MNSHPLLPNKNLDIAVLNKRRLFLSRLVSQAVQALARSVRDDQAPKESHTCHTYQKWTHLVRTIADDLCVDVDSVRMHHVCELYSYGYDKMAEEVGILLKFSSLHGIELACSNIRHWSITV